MDPEIVEGPLEALEVWAQGDVEKINIRPPGAPSDPNFPHAQYLRGRNFADNTFTEVFRHSEQEQQILVPTNDSSDFTHGSGTDDSAIGGGSLRFYARRPLEGVAVLANFTYMGCSENMQVTWSGWWDGHRQHEQGTEILNMRAFRNSDNRRSCCFHWTTNKVIATTPVQSNLDLGAGWHEIRHTATIRSPSNGIQIAIENAELTVFATYR